MRNWICSSVFLFLGALLASGVEAQTLLVNCGGPDLADGSKVFVADRPYAVGSFGFAGGSTLGRL